MNRPLAAIALAASILVIASACTSSAGPGTADTPPPGPAGPASSVAPPTTAPAPPTSPGQSPTLPSAGSTSPGSAPGAFVEHWNTGTFTAASCPAGHPTASCYASNASGQLPLIGAVTMARTTVVGDPGGTTPPPGCVSASTTGTVTGPSGAISFRAAGALCGRTATYTITNSTGGGGMAPFAIRGQIVNDPTGEVWTGTVVAVAR